MDDGGESMLDDVKEKLRALHGGGPLRRAPVVDRRADLAAFQAYWAAQCPKGDIPRRSQIDPRGIEALLSHAFVGERIAPGMARLRIAGMHLSDVMGMEVRAMPLSCLIAPSDRDRFSDAMVDLFDRPARVEVTLEAEGGLGRPALTGRMLLLPLRSDLGDISRALGCLVTQGPIGRAPRRFRIAAIERCPIGAEGMPAITPAAPPSPRTIPHPAERPYLRVVK
ncbi:PAS domain-containing protein [Roseovarius sp. MMSF_3281]|uniref:PAS domain-containing protein n=1 Tax=Roseovarius sp. MMSF_3281 TaxID=3046694 RepID=UPI0027400E17|nr:PAS domain-containing protein [Roseovarius sp. MMSF_3281]